MSSEVGRVSAETLEWERMFHNWNESVLTITHQLAIHGRVLTNVEKAMARIRIFSEHPDIESWKHAGIY